MIRMLKMALLSLFLGAGTCNDPPEGKREEAEAAAAPARAESAADAVEKKPVEPAVPAQEAAGAPEAPDVSFDVVRFAWRPDVPQVASAYRMDDPADQHRIVLPAPLDGTVAHPVILAFHGQPAPDRDPRDYWFPDAVQTQVEELIRTGAVQNAILVIPVFRYVFGNWPQFHPGTFRDHVEALLLERGIRTEKWVAFGHSGAAGCGGAGLNEIHLARPFAVGFFDTCLGPGWQKAVSTLQEKGIPVLNVFSVETAGFRPKQRPEYQADFDFGRAFSHLGIEPVQCPDIHPGDQLRSLPHRCSATADGVVRAFVVDTGEGEQAHMDVVKPALTYFLTVAAGLATPPP